MLSQLSRAGRSELYYTGALLGPGGILDELTMGLDKSQGGLEMPLKWGQYAI